MLATPQQIEELQLFATSLLPNSPYAWLKETVTVGISTREGCAIALCMQYDKESLHYDPLTWIELHFETLAKARSWITAEYHPSLKPKGACCCGSKSNEQLASPRLPNSLADIARKEGDDELERSLCGISAGSLNARRALRTKNKIAPKFVFEAKASCVREGAKVVYKSVDTNFYTLFEIKSGG